MREDVRQKFKSIKHNQVIGDWKIISDHLFTKGKNIYVKCFSISENKIKDIRAYRILKIANLKYNRRYDFPKAINYKGMISSVFNKIKNNAKRRKIEFNITLEDMGDLFEKQNGKCALTGMKLTLKKSLNDKTSTASLDRIDNKKGYLKDNIQWIYRPINFMKGILDENEFIYYCEQVALNKKNKK